MFRTSDIILIAVMVSAAAMTYKIKRDAEVQQTAVYKLQSQIRTEEETIELLRADWSLLTQPARLQKLTELYKTQLNLQSVDARQVVGLDDLPQRPPLSIEDIMAENGAAGIDKEKTASIAKDKAAEKPKLAAKAADKAKPADKKIAAVAKPKPVAKDKAASAAKPTSLDKIAQQIEAGADE
ncbi:hypothetical protein QFZ88_001032 [Mesorhizobium sp. YL-MeA3-2017]|nr:hypothetical protein [Mesorhizobium sp. YL-MeA3-2017]